MNFKCRCGHTLTANPNPGKTQSVTCSCSLTFNVDCTDGGTFIISRAVVGERKQSNATPKRPFVLKPGNIRDKDRFQKGGHIAPLQNVPECGEYVVQQHSITIDENCKCTVSMMNFYDAPIGFRFTILQHELSEAVKAERYEDAAKLRDRIAELEKQIEQ